jgi:hypothetical protein
MFLYLQRRRVCIIFSFILFIVRREYLGEIMPRVTRQSSSSFVFCVHVDRDAFCPNHLYAGPMFKSASTRSTVPVTPGHYAGSLDSANQLIWAQWWSSGTFSLRRFLNLVDSSTFIPLLSQNRSQGNVYIQSTSCFPAYVALEAADQAIYTVECTFCTSVFMAIVTSRVSYSLFG